MRNGKDVDPELMKKMNEKLSHRGPDGSKTWVNDNVGLGHQMLWTTPESLHEELPFEEDDLVITSDARIDNRKELSEKLGIRDEEDVSDSYFILKAYEKWGDACPDKLLGDFAFAIWDTEKEKLFCARDHMGVKPFYYYLDDDMFVFGTEIKALFCVDGVPREINERKIALYLMKDTMDSENTFYKDIKSFPAAHLSLIAKTKFKIHIYWKLDSNLEIKMESEEEYAKAFREIFEEAVRCRLRSSFPIGFELSGGLDSSSIVCMAQEILNNENQNSKIKTFSSVYDESKECDERNYIKKVLNKYEINSTFINGDAISPLKDIENVLWHQDQPFFSPHLTNQIESYKKMKNFQIRILFSGEGGDQIISHGNNYLKELAFKLKWKEVLSELNGASNKFNESKISIIKKNIIYPSIPLFIKKLIKLFLYKKEVNFKLKKDFLKKLKLENKNNFIITNLEKFTSKEYHYFIINHPLAQTVFGIMDRGISKFNLEPRYPFFDKRLVEFCYALPTDMKLKSGWSRYVMRIAMENILPEDIQWRPEKANLNVSFKRNLMLFEKNTIIKMVNEKAYAIKDYVDIQIIEEILEDYKKGNNKNLFDLWLIILFYKWITTIEYNE